MNLRGFTMGDEQKIDPITGCPVFTEPGFGFICQVLVLRQIELEFSLTSCDFLNLPYCTRWAGQVTFWETVRIYVRLSVSNVTVKRLNRSKTTPGKDRKSLNWRLAIRLFIGWIVLASHRRSDTVSYLIIGGMVKTATNQNSDTPKWRQIVLTKTATN